MPKSTNPVITDATPRPWGMREKVRYLVVAAALLWVAAIIGGPNVAVACLVTYALHPFIWWLQSGEEP